MAKPELGTKRICPTTGKKFFDLNRDPIVSPYTGESFPRSIFEPVVKGPTRAKAAPAEADEEEPAAEEGGAELVSLDEVAEAENEEVATSEDDIDVEAEDGAEADDTFLEEEEEGGDDVSDLIDGDIEDDEET